VGTIARGAWDFSAAELDAAGNAVVIRLPGCGGEYETDPAKYCPWGEDVG
jgi:hypothetical protein